MIRISDNSATNILIRKIGMDAIQGWLVLHDFRDTRLQRMMMDFEANGEGRQNYTGPKAMNRILVGLLNEEWPLVIIVPMLV